MTQAEYFDRLAAIHRDSERFYRDHAEQEAQRAERLERRAREERGEQPATMRINPSDRARLTDTILALLRDHGPATARTVALLIDGATAEQAHHSFASMGSQTRTLTAVRRRMGSLERMGRVVKAGYHARDHRQVLYAPAGLVTLADLPPLVTVADGGTGGGAS